MRSYACACLQFMLLVTGHVTLFDEHNRSVLDVHAGECFFIPQGFICSWAHDEQEVQKLFVTQTCTALTTIARPFRVLASDTAEANEILFEQRCEPEIAGSARWCFRVSRVTSPPLHSTPAGSSSEPELRVFVPLRGSALALHASAADEGMREERLVRVGEAAILGGEYRLAHFSTASAELACQFVLVELRSV